MIGMMPPPSPNEKPINSADEVMNITPMSIVTLPSTIMRPPLRSTNAEHGELVMPQLLGLFVRFP